MEHKISMATTEWCREHKVGTVVIGDVRDIADKTKVEHRLKKPERRKISNWPHGQIRNYLNYKLEGAGIQVKDDQQEQYTSQTCLVCGKRQKPRGRVYRCSGCGFVFARDGVGSANILSLHLLGECGRIRPTTVKYRHPCWFGRERITSSIPAMGESVVPSDTGQVARSSV